MTIKVRFTGISSDFTDFIPQFANWGSGYPIETEILGKKFLFSRTAQCYGRTEVDFVEAIELKPRFTVGDIVNKVEGYPFRGVVRATYKNKDGFYRVVVEHEDGWAHIFNEGQLLKDI